MFAIALLLIIICALIALGGVVVWGLAWGDETRQRSRKWSYWMMGGGVLGAAFFYYFIVGVGGSLCSTGNCPRKSPPDKYREPKSQCHDYIVRNFQCFTIDREIRGKLPLMPDEKDGWEVLVDCRPLQKKVPLPETPKLKRDTYTEESNHLYRWCLYTITCEARKKRDGAWSVSVGELSVKNSIPPGDEYKCRKP
jgi:hypothetical protein